MVFTPIPEKLEYSTLISRINNYVEDLSNWDYERPNEDFTIYTLGSNKKVLYFGTYHVRSISDPLISTLESSLESFTAKHTNTAILIEDWVKESFATPQEAVEKRGERGWLMYKADALNLDIIPVDYERSEIYKILDSAFGKGLVNLFAFLYLVKPKMDKSDFTEGEYKNKINDYVKTSFDWIKRYDISMKYDYFNNLYIQQFNRSIWADSKSDVFDILNPTKSMHTLAQTFKRYHSIRDTNFLYQISVNYIEGKNVFVVLGQDHALFSKKFLEQLVSEY